MKKSFTVKFSIGDSVVLRTEPQVQRIVTGLVIRQSGKMYELASGVESSWHQEVEIEKVPDNIKTIRGFKK